MCIRDSTEPHECPTRARTRSRSSGFTPRDAPDHRAWRQSLPYPAPHGASLLFRLHPSEVRTWRLYISWRYQLGQAVRLSRSVKPRQITAGRQPTKGDRLSHSEDCEEESGAVHFGEGGGEIIRLRPDNLRAAG